LEVLREDELCAASPLGDAEGFAGTQDKGFTIRGLAAFEAFVRASRENVLILLSSMDIELKWFGCEL
jgi:hypothetical protein